MDNQLFFNSYICSIPNRAIISLGFINGINKPFKWVTIFKIVYNSFVRSIIDFGKVIWNQLYKCHSDRIERTQGKFIKIRNFRSDRQTESCACSLGNNLLNLNKLLTLQNRRKKSDIDFLFKILNNMLDTLTLLSSKINFISKTTSTPPK